MKRLHEGLDYQLYKIYVFGGLAAIFIFVLVLAFFSDAIGVSKLSDNQTLMLIFAPVTLWILGILAYWWWVFLLKDKRAHEMALEQRYDHAPSLSELKSWSTLHDAMTLYGGDLEAMRKNEKAAKIPVLIFYGFQNLLVLCVLGGAWAYALFNERSPVDMRHVQAIGVISIAVVLFFLIPFLLGRSARAGEAAYLGPLGLSMADPDAGSDYRSGLELIDRALSDDGVMEMSGRRHGRRVFIQAAGKHCLVWVECTTAPFEIESRDGKLAFVGQAPKFGKAALKGLRKAKRWLGIKAGGGPDGVWVERQSRGNNMWLFDLWLLERILEHAEAEI